MRKHSLYKGDYSPEKALTVVLTACDRIDLLKRTLESFAKFNDYPIKMFYIRDDSGLEDVWMQTFDMIHLMKLPYPWRLMKLEQMGQARSIDFMMKYVKTPYVFHLEDDWEFDRPGFIEDCFEVIDDKVAQVRVRHRDDGSATQTVPYNDKADLCTNHLFSFNPHLRKTGLGSLVKFEGRNETELGELVEKSRLKTLWLKEGACRHIGNDKPTNRAGTSYHAGVKKA
jgi:hypothetical protein